MKIKFSKMHGLGNDFVVINMIHQFFSITQKMIKNLSNRHMGIGFDQLLLVERSKIKNIDFHYRIFNANGTEVAQCGNGARCFALFVSLKRLTIKKIFYVSTKNRVLILNILGDGNICVDMGVPCFDLEKIPYLVSSIHPPYLINILGKTIYYDLVTMGNPHCVIRVNDLKKYPVREIGSILSSHKIFPQGINVGFMEILSKSDISLRVYERGVGETLSCGSGACAAVASGINQGLLLNQVKVNLLYGMLDIQWHGNNKKLYMTGPAVHIYDGYFYPHKFYS